MTERLVDTPEGPARTTTTDPGRTSPVGTLVLGHGAGRPAVDPRRPRHPRRRGRRGLAGRPRRPAVAGRRSDASARRPPALDVAWLPVLADVDRHRGPGPARRRRPQRRGPGRLPDGRRRSARRAVVALSFPLHPPGKPHQSRAAELAQPAASGIPVHVVQGRTDPFGRPDEIAAVLPAGATLDVVPGPHSSAVGAAVADRVAATRRGRSPRPPGNDGPGTSVDRHVPAPPVKGRPCSSSTPQPPAGPG